MATGLIKFFNESKGYGFIKEDGTDKEIFVHISGVKANNLRENDKVSYEVQDGKKGISAVNVEKI